MPVVSHPEGMGTAGDFLADKPKPFLGYIAAGLAIPAPGAGAIDGEGKILPRAKSRRNLGSATVA